jgi:DNA-binding transcriptional ArsR family regulator
MSALPIPDLATIGDDRGAALVLHPLRRRLLELARTPCSATSAAAVLRMPRQKVNYHLRELARAGLLRRAGQQRKGNLIERRWIAVARGFVIDPALLGAIGPDLRSVADAASASRILALAARAQSEVAQAAQEAARAGKRVSTLSAHAELRFEGPEQRARFAAALEDAIAAVVAKHASPFRSGGRAGAGRPYRLTVTCHPIPPSALSEP